MRIRFTLEIPTFWNPGVSPGGLKILQVWVRPPLGAQLRAQSIAHSVEIIQRSIMNAYINAYTINT